MRLKNREITEWNDIIETIKKCEVCRIAMNDESAPYIVPLNFGMEVIEKELYLFFHSALEGKKVDLLRKNPHVAFEMEREHEIYVNDANTMCSCAYASIIGKGIMEEVESKDKKRTMDILLAQVPEHQNVKYNEKVLDKVIMWRLRVHEISGKRNLKQ